MRFRALAFVLIVQLVLAAGFVVWAAAGFPPIDRGEGTSRPAARDRATGVGANPFDAASSSARRHARLTLGAAP